MFVFFVLLAPDPKPTKTSCRWKSTLGADGKPTLRPDGKTTLGPDEKPISRPGDVYFVFFFFGQLFLMFRFVVLVRRIRG